jgi:hypothetical protein
MTRSWWLILSMVALVLLASCTTKLRPPVALSVDTSSKERHPAVAIEGDGTKHVAWENCDFNNVCSIISYKTWLGNALDPVTFTPIAGHRYVNPDVTVDSQHNVFLVWQDCDALSCVDRYGMIPPTGAVLTGVLTPASHISGGPPRVAANGPTVYAATLDAVNGASGKSVYLRYTLLTSAGGGASGLIAGLDEVIIHDQQLQVDSQGRYHVVYSSRQVVPTGIYQAVFYGRQDIGPQLLDSNISLSDTTYSLADLAVRPDDTAYVVYAVYGASDSLKLGTTTSGAGSTTLSPISLPAVQNPWKIHGRPKVSSDSSSAILAFSATNANTAGYAQIWRYTSANTGTLTQLTTSPITKSEPLVGFSDSGLVVLLAWRDETAASCLQNSYYYMNASGGVVQVFSTPTGCAEPGMDLAVNGDWAVGVFPDRQSAGDPRQVIWATMNAHRRNLPMVVN